MTLKLRVLQTADDVLYRPMLEATAPLTRAFCERHGFEYRAVLGRVRGSAPVHAAFNRIFLMSQMVAEGYDGWLLYLDADAWIQDIDFDVTTYIAERAPQADFIAAEASADVPQRWAINNGVFLINLGSPVGRYIVNGWRHLADALVPDAYWADPQADWPPPEYDDQNMLYRVLASDQRVLERVYKANGEVLNYRGRFIGQCLRADYPSFAERLAHVQRSVSALMLASGLVLPANGQPVPEGVRESADAAMAAAGMHVGADAALPREPGADAAGLA